MLVPVFSFVFFYVTQLSTFFGAGAIFHGSGSGFGSEQNTSSYAGSGSSGSSSTSLFWIKCLFLFFVSIPICAFAGWQIALTELQCAFALLVVICLRAFPNICRVENSVRKSSLTMAQIALKMPRNPKKMKLMKKVLTHHMENDQRVEWW